MNSYDLKPRPPLLRLKREVIIIIILHGLYCMDTHNKYLHMWVFIIVSMQYNILLCIAWIHIFKKYASNLTTHAQIKIQS